jgi:hypothetical protein
VPTWVMVLSGIRPRSRRRCSAFSANAPGPLNEEEGGRVELPAECFPAAVFKTVAHANRRSLLALSWRGWPRRARTAGFLEVTEALYR